MSLRSILESLFFATDEPLDLKRLVEVIPDSTPDEINDNLDRWREELEADKDSGTQLIEIAGGFLLATKPENAEIVDRLLERRRKRLLSQAALETLAVIAYREPVTRGDIEGIRGVSADSIVHTLLQRRLIKISGRKNVPGHPFLYKTSKHFLNHFGLRDRKELPNIEELSQVLSNVEQGLAENPDDLPQLEPDGAELEMAGAAEDS